VTGPAHDVRHGASHVLAAAATLLALPLVGLGVLLAWPQSDIWLEHHPTHFWLVLAVATVSAVLAYGTGVAAVRRADARVLLVSLTFLSASGFLGLHALATPGILLESQNVGFTVATPVGLAVGSVFAALSSAHRSAASGTRTVSAARALRLGLLIAMALWAVASLAELPPLRGATPPERASGPFLVLALPAIALYGVAAVRYVRFWWHHRSLLLLGMAAAFVLLGEAMIAVVFAVNWHASWWEWHVLMLLAFGFVAWTAHQQWHEERYADLYMQNTLAGVRDMSVLFADLQGFTRFSEAHDAQDVTAMLNEYFEVAVPVTVRRFGGEIDRIVGDAVMVVFNRRGDQPDHPRRAAGAALALQEATAEVAAEHPGWPIFRVGVNSGEASVSLLGAAGGRTFTVIGDTVNVASRLEGTAPVGGVAISAATAARLEGANVERLGLLDLKGRSEPLEVFRLVSLG